jgi:glycosyltransferase involved in cell wall biosynthesis
LHQNKAKIHQSLEIRPMTIGMLLNAPYPSDVRVKKETGALLKRGFTIHLLCLRQNKDQKTEEIFEGITITRIDAGTNNYSLAFWDVIMSTTFQHPRFKKAIPAWVKKNNIQALHIHDLPLVGTALALREELQIPVIADFHENYPEGLKTWFEWKKNPIARLKNKIFMNPKRWEKHERKAALEADHVIAVVDEMKQRLINDHQVDPNKITVVTNSEGADFLLQPEDKNVYGEYADKFIVTYSGNIGPHRGVDTAIEAMQHLRAYPAINLLIIGSGGNAIMNFLKQLVAQYNLKSQVHFFGRQPFNKFYSYMKFASVNLIPHKSNGHTDNTVPHKLFQAMMVGKPVMVSSSAPLKRIVTKTKGGLIFQAGNATDLAEKILELYKNENLQKTLGTNGLNATVNGEMNWEHDQQNLINLYNSFLKNTATKI